MEWAILMALAIGLWLLLRKTAQQPKAQKHPPVTLVKGLAAQRQREAYAQIKHRGEYRDLTAEGVRELAAPFRAKSGTYRRSAAAAVKAADSALQTLKVDSTRLLTWKKDLADLRSDLRSLEKLNDDMFFRGETAADRFYQLVDDLNACEGDLEEAIEQMEDIRDNRANYE